MRLIDGDALNAYLQDEYHGAISDSELKVYQIMRLIDNAPTIDPVRRGRWKHRRFSAKLPGSHERRCVACENWSLEHDKKFCPNCGARMEGERE